MICLEELKRYDNITKGITCRAALRATRLTTQFLGKLQSLLKELQRPPMAFRMKFKLFSLLFNAPFDLVPTYTSIPFAQILTP